MTDFRMQDDEAELAKLWDLPYVEDKRSDDPDKTNAFNQRSDWKYEPPEQEVEILPPTAEEIEAIRAEAYQEGLKEGREAGLQSGHEEGFAQGKEEGLAQGKEEGLAAGLEEGRAQVEKQIADWQALMEQLHQPVSQVEKQLQNELIGLALSLAKGVIRNEVKTNHDIVFQALSEGLKVLPIGESQYQIHLHPDDIALIKSHFSDEEIDKHHWLFIEAPHLSRGGCDITTQSNAVDVTIERRVKDVINKFVLEQGVQALDGDEL